MFDEMLINMLTKMIGLSQEEMQAYAEKALQLINTIGAEMNDIKQTVDRIETILNADSIKVIEHDNGSASNAT